MEPKKKYYADPSNTVYVIDGASYGVSDDLVGAVRDSITRRLQSKTLEIPRLPQVATRIMELSNNPEIDFDTIVETISTDAVLATRVLTKANSAMFAGGQRVEGLKPALMRLGFGAVRDLVFAESVRLRVFSARSYRPMLEESWMLSLGTALSCDALAAETGIERDGAFLLGLLHDTGKPVLVSAVAEIEKKNQNRPLGAEIVETLVSQLHEETGAHVLQCWEMPESFVTAARDHHRYRNASTMTPAQRLVHAGNLVCRHLGIGGVQQDVSFTIDRVFADLELADADRMEPILYRVKDGMEKMMSGMSQAA